MIIYLNWLSYYYLLRIINASIIFIILFVNNYTANSAVLGGGWRIFLWWGIVKLNKPENSHKKRKQNPKVKHHVSKKYQNGFAVSSRLHGEDFMGKSCKGVAQYLYMSRRYTVQLGHNWSDSILFYKNKVMIIHAK
jgi:hypothetical protein